jgi:tetratricopeptide (TPR) repeat protein
LEFYEQFAAHGASDPTVRQDVARAHLRAAFIRHNLGQNDLAERAHRRSIAIQEALVSDPSTQADLILDLGLNYGDLGYVLVDLGRDAESVAAFRRRVQVLERLGAAHPEVPEYHHLIGASLDELASLTLSSGAPAVSSDEMRRLLRAAVNHGRVALDAVPANVEYHRALAKHYFGLGLRSPDPAEAAEARHRAIDLYEAIAAADPNAPFHVDILNPTFHLLAKALQQTGRLEEAEQAYRHALRIHESQVANYPNVWFFRLELANLEFDFGQLLRTRGDLVGRTSALRRAVELSERLVSEQPQFPSLGGSLAFFSNELAWLLVIDAHPQSCDTARAIALAERATSQMPGNGYYMNTLGVAYYRAGRWQIAVETLRGSQKLNGDRALGYDGLFLAMAHWRLGHKEDALYWYNRAIAWIETHDRKNQEFVRFRAEAEALIGLPINSLPADVFAP